MATVLHSAPRFASNEGVIDTLSAALGPMLLAAKEEHGEVVLTVARGEIENALRLLRDQHQYQQLMEMAGADYPSRVERFEVVYMLLSVTRNHRLLVKVGAAENAAVPTVTTLWPNAGWLEREVFDMYGVVFDGNPDLRRILTDYGFEGHPFRKDFPLTGYQELRYSEEEKRVVYEPVKLAQDLRSFDFMSPWEGADYVLPGDEKAVAAPPPPPAPPPPSPPAPAPAPAPAATVAETPKTTDGPADTGAGTDANAEAVKHRSPGSPSQQASATAEPGAPDPTESRPEKKPRASTAKSASAKLTTERKPRTKKTTKTDADNEGGEA